MTDFDQMAADWDKDAAKVERARLVAQAIRDLAGPMDGKTALEYGCGTGLLGLFLQAGLARLTLADTSEGMLAVVQEKLAAGGLEHVATLNSDLAADPVPGAPFDLICTLMALHHVPDTEGLLERFHALLAPGGRLCIADLDTEDGSFHGAEVEVHRGFDRGELTGKLARAGFGNPRFATPFVIEREAARFPVFLVVADRA